MKGHEIFRGAAGVCESPEVLVCKLVDGTVTYIHRRLWPALVKLASRFRKEQLAKVWNEHTPDRRALVPTDALSRVGTQRGHEARRAAIDRGGGTDPVAVAHTGREAKEGWSVNRMPANKAIRQTTLRVAAHANDRRQDSATDLGGE
jgi:hypothetical protein